MGTNIISASIIIINIYLKILSLSNLLKLLMQLPCHKQRELHVWGMLHGILDFSLIYELICASLILFIILLYLLKSLGK